MAKSIMIQGTMSNTGKSVLAAALCRILRQEGYRVAPFKSQNMALNSFITRDGLEMGRAQVMQAEAAGVEPSVAMNPILLKPTSDIGSQVIVNGEVWGTMGAGEYFRRKKELIPTILEAYHTLERQYDIIVLEGAGSPAEINLNQDDIVNMGMARMAGAPVLLAGDIDRGGVFAALYGTLELLRPQERDMVKGTLINKFRGDVEILRPGLDMLRELTKIPVLGVIPWLDLDLDDEDSLSQRFSAYREGRSLDVAVIRLPRLSNFTDFAPLERHEDMGLRYVTRPEELGRPDLVILPGTKSTLSDLKWLRECGLEAAILKLSARATPVIGICGGFQMLGHTLSDPECVEGGGQMRGLGLLPMNTVFSREKTRKQTEYSVHISQGFFAPLSGIRVEGYEIHMGQSDGQGPIYTQDRVLGTYLHGLFDSAAFTQALVEQLREEKGLPRQSLGKAMDLRRYKEEQYDRLADAVRHSLDLNAVMDIIQRGV